MLIVVQKTLAILMALSVALSGGASAEGAAEAFEEPMIGGGYASEDEISWEVNPATGGGGDDYDDYLPTSPTGGGDGGGYDIAFPDSGGGESAWAPSPGNPTNTVELQPGVLTAGEWNDNENFDFLLELMESNEDWEAFAAAWDLSVARRIAVTVTDDEDIPLVNARVELLDDEGNVVWSTLTDNSGTAYLFAGIHRQSGRTPVSVCVTTDALVSERSLSPGQEKMAIVMDPMEEQPWRLDLMLVIDTTGSMSDELEFLKVELENVIARIQEENPGLGLRLSINVYRDHGDEYVVRSTPFTSSIEESVAFLRQQYAEGGGDTEEAVEIALADAIWDHEWNDQATARLLLLVLDAPPHNTAEIAGIMRDLTAEASYKGIHIIPVASSGVDKDTEFLLRSLSAATGGTYVFLTDDSGIGEEHLEPTIGEFEVEALDDLLVRVIGEYVRRPGA